MRYGVPVLVILSLTRVNQKHRIDLVAYSFWHHYQTNFVKTYLFPIISNKLWAASARLPEAKFAKFEGMELLSPYEIVLLKVKF